MQLNHTLRIALLATTTLALLFAITDESHSTISRREEDRVAKAAFLGLNFFHKGLGMHISPDLIQLSEVAERVSRATKIDNPLLKNRYGLAQVDGKVVGLFNEKYEGIEVGVLGCVACHSGKAAGQFIVGIGNKNIDVGRIGSDAFRVQKAWRTLKPEGTKSDAYRRVQESAIAFARELADPARQNQTQGLVATSVIRKWFYRMADVPYPENMPRGAVKVPHLFGYAEKRKVGQFSDGGGNGLLPGWGAAVELAAGQTAENIREYLPKLERTENLLGQILPPKYPFAVDARLVSRGKVRFEATCAKCHGTYREDAEGLPIFAEPKMVSASVVKTDHERLDALTDDFLSLIERSPLADLIQQTEHHDQYVAPRLDGIWARFPYLHNGSVPTVRDLLTAAGERPIYFELKNAGEKSRFDEKNLGLDVRGHHEIKRRPVFDSRSVYDSTLVGQSHAGHEFQTALSEQEKSELIEYLKTL